MMSCGCMSMSSNCSRHRGAKAVCSPVLYADRPPAWRQWSWQELTSSLTPGRNDVRIELSNAATCCSTALRMFLNRDTTLLFADALRKRDSSAGITYNKTVVIDRQKCATDTAPNS